MEPKTAVVKDAIYLQHITGDSHPESHHRLEMIYDMLQDEDMQGIFKELSPRPATQAELELNHSLDYIHQVAVLVTLENILAYSGQYFLHCFEQQSFAGNVFRQLVFV